MARRSTTKRALLLFLLVGMLPVRASAQDLVVLKEGVSMTALGKHLEYLADEEGRWAIEDVSSTILARKFKKSDSEIPNFGFTTTPYWFRVQLLSALKEQQKFLLEIPFAVLDRIDMFLEQGDGTFFESTVGDGFPQGNKLIDHQHFVFPLKIDPGSKKRIFFRIETSGVVQAPLNLWTPEAFWDKESENRLLYGVLFGFLIVMGFYNLFIYFAIRDRSYLYLVLIIICGFVVIATHLGLAQQYLWPSVPWLANRMLPLGIYATGLTICLFTGHFLDVEKNLPAWRRPFSIFVIFFSVGSVLSFFMPYNLAVLAVTVLGTVFLAVMLVVPVIAWRQGFKPARYYLMAWAILLCGSIVTAINKLGFFPRTTLTENAYMIGSAMGVVLFSFALADRINLLRKEKDQAQTQALEVQRLAAENLEQQVQVRTRELEQAYERLAEHDRLKSRFFSNVSHEVRTPLTLILTPLERLLENKQLPADVRQQLRSMSSNTQRLLRLVNQLLDFSRLESGGTTVSYERVDIRAVTDAIVEAFEPFARSKGLKLKQAESEEVPDLYTDPVKLDKVLSNLLSNACKFTGSGGTVTVELTGHPRFLTIEVKDTGIGIAEQDLPRIFERFHQVDSGPSRRYGGTGIGLALSKELVELIGGTLSASSNPGTGSCFTVTLPLGREHIEDPALIRSENQGQTREVPAAWEASTMLAAEGGIDAVAPAPHVTGEHDTRPKILVVEDNPDMRNMVAEICQQEFRVLQAADGEQGLTMIKEHRPALVISDIMMPNIDGHELLRRIRAEPSMATIPVIMLTAKAGPQMRLEGLESGANDYLAKPFEARELLARTRNMVQLQRQELRLRELNARLQQQVVQQTTVAERARMLGRYLSPEVVRSILEGKQVVQVGQQRRHITVFRLELRGFEQVTEVVEAQDMAAMLNSYLWAMMEVAFDRGATVDAFIQDTVRGFFGAPASKSPDQDALRCARMAVEMWQRAVEVCQQWQAHLMERLPTPTMILTSGVATVGNFGSSSRMEYTAVGGPVNEAAVLLPHVRKGMVACSQSAWKLIEREIKGQPCEPVRLPNRSGTVKLYQLAALDQLDMAPTPAPSFAAEASEGLAISSTPAEEAGLAEVDQLAKGTLVAERYEVTCRLGGGSTGAVYRVKDMKMGVEAALKLIWHHLRADPKSLARLYREVRLAWLVSHPNVARIYDLGEWKGHEFISMEYIDGLVLAKRLKSLGPLPVEEGMQVLRQVCAGLAAAHLAGIVHRDLKPANVMLERGGRVVILDFGIARWIHSLEKAESEIPETTGTPAYMAPEQFAGGEVDYRTDIYSLGVMACQMFTGHRPFEAENVAAIANKHLHEPPPDLQTLGPELPPRLAAVILRCLEKRPEDRFATVEEILPLISVEVADH